VKIAFVTETFPPEINGVAMTFGVITRELSRRHSVTVYRPTRSDLTQREKNSEIKEISLPGIPIPKYPELRLGLPAHGKLRKLWLEDRPDLVHVATEGPLGASAISIAKKLNIPVTSSFHTNFHTYTKHYGIGAFKNLAIWWLKHVHNRTLATFTPTEELIAELSTEGFKNLSILSRGVDSTHFGIQRRSEELRATWGAKSDDPVVLHVGRMAPEKNYTLLFKAYKHMLAIAPNARFIMVGDGPLKPRLEKEFPNAIFTGFVSRENLAQHYASADIYIHASLSETFGNVLTEAMASGLATLSFDYAATRKFVVNNKNGLCVALGDNEGFITASARLISEQSLRTRIGNEAHKSIKSQSWEIVIQHFEKQLCDIVDKFNSTLPQS
jgi:glycosyltransferase involved in cell wall biosynthesis